MPRWEATQAKRRATLLALLVAGWVILIIGRLVQLQIFQHHFYRSRSDRIALREVEIRAPRGSIFDRAGRPLAVDLPVDSVYVNPKLAPEPAVTAGILGPVLGLSQPELEAGLADARRRRRGFLWIKRRVSFAEAQRLRGLSLDWIGMEPDTLRVYPKGVLAAHVLGGVDFEGRGNAGIEQSLEADLRGRAGAARLLHDAGLQGVDSHSLAPAVPGKNVTLTIEERIQHVAERELAKAVRDSNSLTGSVVVMDPKTGDLLALASYPPYDPNRPLRTEAEKEARANHAVSVPFEPGSVFKVVTVTAALETTRLTPETVIPCGGGRFNLFGRVIHDHHPYGALPVADVLAKSSNIGAIQIGLTVGEQNLWNYVRRFGFGRSTGVALPGESAGKVRELDDWGRTSIGSVAMGHEISTTTVQLAQAIAAIANGGLLRKPRLVLSRQRPGEPAERTPLEAPRSIIRPETAITMRRLMEGVVLHGTGTTARLDGYTAGGKTGSAQIFDPVCRCYLHKYNSSFAGFAPVANPAVVVVVTVNGASVFGGVIAAPVFREVATAALRLRNVPRDLPDSPPRREGAPVDLADLAIADLGSLAAQLPPPGASENRTSRDLWGPKVPDFYGKTVRAVAEESSQLGLPVQLTGSGVARAQVPTAGSILPVGGHVRIVFAQ